jgi:hypothetical protein
MSKKKLLIITPHLSTGGAPQVTLNKIELLKEDYTIKCVEYSQIAWTFVVQRNKIINLLGDNFHSLPEDKQTILNLINEFKPDVISFEEFPEFFIVLPKKYIGRIENTQFTKQLTTQVFLSQVKDGFLINLYLLVRSTLSDILCTTYHTL